MRKDISQIIIIIIIAVEEEVIENRRDRSGYRNTRNRCYEQKPQQKQEEKSRNRSELLALKCSLFDKENPDCTYEKDGIKFERDSKTIARFLVNSGATEHRGGERGTRSRRCGRSNEQ